MVVVFLCKFSNNYIIIVHQVLTHPIHMFTHPFTHISPHPHSLGGKDDSLSSLPQRPRPEANTNPGGEKKGHLSLVK
jgi:hypothetical protein